MVQGEARKIHGGILGKKGFQRLFSAVLQMKTEVLCLYDMY
jgi:hypothetical protein